MRTWSQRLVGAGLLALFWSGPSQAATIVVVGDSIGVGIATAAGLKTSARPSVSLRRNNLAAEIANAPANAVVILSAGTNDALDPLKAVAPAIEKTIDIVTKANRRVVWVGPPCSFNRWAKGTETLDAYLRERLAKTAIQYVSLRDSWICNPANRAGDGVHFRHAGYVYLWQKVRRESSLVAEIHPIDCNQPGKPVGKGALVAGQVCSAKKSAER